MPESSSNTQEQAPAHFQLRYRIMTYLYEQFQGHPAASVDIRDLKEACQTEPKDLNWNLAYLEKKGLVALGRAEDFPPYIAALVDITAEGIDLVEDAPQLKEMFKQA